MSHTSKHLDEKEKAVLTMHVFLGCEDWRKMYILSDDKPAEENEKLKYIDTYVSRWKNTPKVKQYVAELQKIKTEQEIRIADKAREEERQRIHEESERGESARNSGKTRLIDYSDPKEQQRKLNELVNTAQDQKEALDALKTIIATQKDDRDAAKERKTVTAYLPLLCYQCPLYLKAQEKQPKKGTI